jgi:hypothetical protein
MQMPDSVSAQRIKQSRTINDPFKSTLLLAATVLLMCFSGTVFAQLVINEIMQNPLAVDDGDGEWFEIHNPTAGGIDIDGWTIRDDDFDSHLIDNGGPLMIPAGAYLVLGNNDDSGTNGGVAVDYSYGGDMFLSNSADELILEDGKLMEIDRVEWDGGPNFPDPTGASMSLADPALDNNIGANWCTASTPFGAGDLGTPSDANDCADVLPELVINEIIQNPDAVSDTNGEWFEVFNPTANPVDMEGWTIEDNGSDSHVINNGGPLVVPAGGYLVLGRDANFAANGGVNVDYQYANVFLGPDRGIHVPDRSGARQQRRRELVRGFDPLRRWRPGNARRRK